MTGTDADALDAGLLAAVDPPRIWLSNADCDPRDGRTWADTSDAWATDEGEPVEYIRADLHEAALKAERVRGEESMRAGDLSDFWTRHAAWSNATFGDESERGPLGPLRHLEKEAKEAQDATDDILEYADCLLLILDATRRAGFTLADLTDAANRKLEICKARVWPKTAKDQAVEHVRTPTTDQETTHG